MTAIETVLAELQTERRALQARLDAIDLSLENLQRVYGAAAGSTPQHGRRAQVLAAIAGAPKGLTLAALRAAFPDMRGRDRSNTLQRLKVAGEIRRRGRTWVRA